MPDLIDGRYEVLSKIKDGGMGTVYKVRHVHLDDVRVVKVMRAEVLDDPGARARFLREARLAKALRHENIAEVLDFAEDRQRLFYMVMEFVDGPSVGEFLSLVGVPSLRAALDISIQSLHALGYLHRKGIVHRDVSPENILLTVSEDGRPLVKLIDLGIAKEASGEGLTLAGAFLGKLKYASPEQLGALHKGETIDGRSDVYSLGCVLYCLLTGELPFRSDTPQGYAMNHLMGTPRGFDETDRSERIPPRLRALVLRALERDRESRWPTAEEFAHALEAIRRDLVTSPSDREEIARAVRRFRDERDRADAQGEGSTQVVTPVPGAFAAPPEALPPAPPTWVTAAPALRRPARKRLSIAIGGLVAIGALAVLVRSLRPRSSPPRAVAAPSGTILLTSSPWARVVSVTDEATGRAVPTGSLGTPLRLELPAGRYRVQLAPGPPGLDPLTVSAAVAADRETAAHADFPGFDLEAAVRTYAP